LSPIDPREKLSDLRAAVSDGAGGILLLVHDYPDPDCLGAAYGLQALLETWRISSVIAHGGGLGRPENKAMAGLLEITSSLIDNLDLAVFRGAVLIDTQPGAGNNSLPPELKILAVIDHHQPSENSVGQIGDGILLDIRLDYSASSTIVLEYLEAAGVTVARNLATALYLGIKTDTDSLERESSRMDVDAYVKLLPMVDFDVLRKITHAPLPDEYYSYLQSALRVACRYGEALVANVGAIETPDFLSAISDMMILAKGTAWALAVGWKNRKVYLSLRVRPPRKNAGNIMRKSVGEEGHGGGHGLAAGGQILPANGNYVLAAENSIKRFLEVVKVSDQQPPRLLCLKKRRGAKTIYHFKPDPDPME
jgi:nanoRNase/pAp phosphatase (c-di-AMP/oligoRNAs hydrolase)